MSKEFKLSRLRIVNSLIQLRLYFAPVLKTPLCGVTISVVLSFECKLNWPLSFQLVNKQLSLLNKIWVVFAIDKKTKSHLSNAKELTSQITEVSRPQGNVRLPPTIQINITWSTLPEWGSFWYWINLQYFSYWTQLSQKNWYCLVLCEV